MKRINVDINEEEYQRLKEIAHDNGVSASKLIGAFVQDLVDSNRRGGSDEHYKAWQWLQRTWLEFR